MAEQKLNSQPATFVAPALEAWRSSVAMASWHCTPQVALARMKAAEYAYGPGGEIAAARRSAGDMRERDPAAGDEEEKGEQALLESSVEGDSWEDDPLAMHADLIL